MKLYAYECKPNDFKDWDAAEKEIGDNEKRIEQEDAEARKNKTLVGRIIRKGVADGYAAYQVIKVNKTTARVRHLVGLGDDYMETAWGREATVSLDVLAFFLRY